LTAASYTDNTPYPDTKELAYAQILSMGRDKNKPNKINKIKMHDSLKRVGKIKVFDHYEDKEEYNEATKSTDTVKVEVFRKDDIIGRDLSLTVSALVEVIKDLNLRIDELEAWKNE